MPEEGLQKLIIEAEARGFNMAALGLLKLEGRVVR